jgi:hypothetical protein
LAESVGVAVEKLPWWLRVLYATLLVSAVALVILVAGDVVSALESEEGELHHLFVFDLAWPVFVLGSLLALTTGVGALVAGAIRRSAPTLRYGMWAAGFCVLAVVVVVASESLGS